MSAWPEPVERVAEFLRRVAVESRVEEFPAGTKTAEDAARAVGCDVGQIVKSLVFLCDGRPVLVMVGGDRRADRAKVEAAVPCEKAKIAGPEEVRAATGFEPGAVAPFPLPGVETVLVDQELLVHEVVWTGAGSHQHVLAIAPAELARLTRARSVDAVAEDA
jgi:prolyl-tRNA editing enzyme YbaK/EbsC (Cys-tRNA(Pro) deacylase)